MMTVSVVIPFYNESESIKETLSCLDNQEYSPHEVIFVDSGSTDNTSQIINSHIDKLNKDNYRVIYCGEMSPSSSLNRGIKESSSELIAYIDCGLNIPSNWLVESLRIMETHNCGIVSLRIKTNGTSLIDKSFIAQTYGLASHTTCLPGSLIKKSVIEQIGGLITKTRASYDVDFINKIKKNNIKRVINTKTIINYFGVNYADNLISGSKKVYSYSLNAWNAEGDYKPYIYLLSLSILFISYIYDLHYHAIIAYFALRGYITPIIKSKIISFFSEPSLLFTMPITGLIIDVSRLTGYIKSYKFHDE
jgi:glycosyltransferase involved in cell wall biosynthesis